MDFETILECTKLSDEEKITFPEVVLALQKAGIESYVANLLVPNKIYFAKNESFETAVKVTFPLKVGPTFNQDLVIEALRAIQSQKISYQAFLQRIMDAGTIAYFVFINGKKAIYIGRNGEQYIENFPQKP